MSVLVIYYKGLLVELLHDLPQINLRLKNWKRFLKVSAITGIISVINECIDKFETVTSVGRFWALWSTQSSRHLNWNGDIKGWEKAGKEERKWRQI